MKVVSANEHAKSFTVHVECYYAIIKMWNMT